MFPILYFCSVFPFTQLGLREKKLYYIVNRYRVGWGIWSPRGVTISPPMYYVSFTCLKSMSGGRIQWCHLLTEKQTLAKKVNKYLALNALLHIYVWCNRCVFIMFYYSNKIKHSLVQVLLYLCVVYRASFTFLWKWVIIIISAGIYICVDRACWRQEAPRPRGERRPGGVLPHTIR